MSDLAAVTTYGRDGAGARVRVFEWVERLVPDATVYSYTGSAHNSPSELLSSPLATLAAERMVRGLVKAKQHRLLVHRQVSPFGRGGLEARLLRSAGLGVYDFDDGLPWDAPDHQFARNMLRSSAAKCTQSVRHADRVIAGNDYLADWSSQFARDVVVIPSCVDPQIYRAKDDYQVSDPPRLVWIGSSSGERYLYSIESALLRLHEEIGARVTIIGDAQATLEGPLEPLIDRVQWHEGRAERQLAAFDVGLGPLTDDRFSRGKSAYKLLQYGAAGLPFVASPVGTNETVTGVLGGRLAADETEWVDQVRDIVSSSASHRRGLGESSRRAVEARYSFDSWRDVWLKALELADP